MGYVIRAVFFPTRVWIAAQAAISSSQRGGGCREWDAVVILKNKKKKEKKFYELCPKMQSSIFWKRRISGLQLLDMLGALQFNQPHRG